MKLSSILFKYAHPYVLLCYLHLLLAFSAVICMFLRGNLLSRKPLHRRCFFFSFLFRQFGERFARGLQHNISAAREQQAVDLGLFNVVASWVMACEYLSLGLYVGNHSRPTPLAIIFFLFLLIVS